MLAEVTDCLSKCCMAWKPSSLEVLSSASAAEAVDFELAHPSGQFLVRSKNQMAALGVMLSRDGDTVVSLEHRFVSGSRAFCAHRKALSNRLVNTGNRIAFVLPGRHVSGSVWM